VIVTWPLISGPTLLVALADRLHIRARADQVSLQNGPMPERLGAHLVSWASEIDEQTLAQARRTARLPFIEGHVALMPDAHLGKGATVGSVIPTAGAIVPAAVGVDIGCGMIAVETGLGAADLPDTLDPLMGRIERHVPAGVGQGHDHRSEAAEAWFATHDPSAGRPEPFSTKQVHRTLTQFGTLGSGNHFLEVGLDERDVVWVVLHSGSRGVGNELATRHIETAKRLARHWFIPLDDADLAYLVQGTAEFDAYIADMTWAQEYAFANRAEMMDVALRDLFALVGQGQERQRINCHHNFTTRERHGGRDLWITRKGAIRARTGDRGVIPGSMGTSSYIVRGLGSPASFESCSHGAGRRHSRTKAKKLFTAEHLEARMAGKSWNRDRAAALVDEIPDAYKDIERVMEDQRDLVEVEHSLRQVFNYKG
jgi:tRNA-splicing ligase RtcB (3'-phosphate/5'-hydroxy nucleic acid ligase)